MMNWTVGQFDPIRAEFIENPYPFYERLREEDPIHFFAPHRI